MTNTTKTNNAHANVAHTVALIARLLRTSAAYASHGQRTIDAHDLDACGGDDVQAALEASLALDAGVDPWAVLRGVVDVARSTPWPPGAIDEAALAAVRDLEAGAVDVGAHESEWRLRGLMSAARPDVGAVLLAAWTLALGDEVEVEAVRELVELAAWRATNEGHRARRLVRRRVA